MLVLALSLVVSASDGEDLAALLRRGKALDVKADATWTEQRYDTYSADAEAWRKDAGAMQRRDTLSKKDAIALLKLRIAVLEAFRANLGMVPVPKSMEAFGPNGVAVWKDSISKWQRALATEVTALKEELRKRSSSP